MALERFAVSRRNYQAAEHQANAGGRAVSEIQNPERHGEKH